MMRKAWLGLGLLALVMVGCSSGSSDTVAVPKEATEGGTKSTNKEMEKMLGSSDQGGGGGGTPQAGLSMGN